LFDVRDLAVRFETYQGVVRAVQGVSFTLERGETLGLVGESGSGKSVTCMALLGLIPRPPGVIEGGQALFNGRDLFRLAPRELGRVRGNELAMIFQDPMSSLNPLLTVERQLTEVLEVHKGLARRAARVRAAAALGDVGIPEPEARLLAYPHELSGGMRQRVMIAMALLCEPAVLFADEPTTALDVTVQAQILDLMAALQKKRGTAIVLITHDLGVVAGMADRVNVMYAGRIVESGPTHALFDAPRHPYTEGLLASVPSLEGSHGQRLYSIEGQPPDLAALPAGCAFGPRCSYLEPRCRVDAPKLEPLHDAPARRSACFEERRLTSLKGSVR
jgi:oligopeptide/dipeptide ABC transporter ATP-binding protein